MTNPTALVTLLTIGAALANPNYSNDINWRVVGGDDAAPGQFPFIISLRYGNSHTCGGSILGGKWVVTAAHCVIGYPASVYTVVAGTNKLNEGGVSYKVKRTIIHAEYNPSYIFNDIALLELERAIETTNLIQPIPLDVQNVDASQACILIGWGRTSYPGNIPNNLQFLDVRSITYQECKAMWLTNPVYETEICTLTRVGEGSCHGDSGGPLVTIANNGKVKLTGLVSWGSPCARGMPDVYTRVSSFIDWILYHILNE